MLFTGMLVTKPQLNHGVLGVLLLVFQEYVVVVPTDLVKVPLVTCAVVDVCLPQPKHGEDGIAPSTRTKEDMLFAQQLLLVPFHLLSWPVDTKSRESQKYRLFAQTLSKVSLKLNRLLPYSKKSTHTMMYKNVKTQRKFALEKVK